MQYFSNEERLRPSLRQAHLAMLVSATIAVGLSQAAIAEPGGRRDEIRIIVGGEQLNDVRALAGIRRKIGLAAHELCDSTGLGTIYRNQGRRCRERVTEEAGRQLEARIAQTALASVEAEGEGAGARLASVSAGAPGRRD